MKKNLRIGLFLCLGIITYSCTTNNSGNEVSTANGSIVADIASLSIDEVSNDGVKDNFVGRWEYTFDRNDGMGNITYDLEILDDKNAYYRPCYDDCVYVGTYKIENNTLYFEGIEGGDNVEPESAGTVKVKFNIKGSSLVGEKGEIFAKARIETPVYREEITEEKPSNYSKLTREDIAGILNNTLFLYKNRDGYYVSFEFDYKGLDDDGNPTFMTKEKIFVPDLDIATTPAEVLMNSFSGFQTLGVDTGIKYINIRDLNDEWIILKKKSIHDDLRFFKIKVTKIIKNPEGKIIQSEVSASTQGGIQLSMSPKNK